MRMVLKYSRDGAAKYISHLDMQRAFGRALRRSHIPVEYSNGYNPHIIMSFASPLSVGYATEADYVEVSVADSYDAALAKDDLNGVLPADIRIKKAFKLTAINKKLMSLNHSASYIIAFTLENTYDCDKIKEALQRITSSGTYVTSGRKGKDVDIVPLILETAFTDCSIEATLMNSSAKTLNPAVLADAVISEAGLAAVYTIRRRECYAFVDGKTAPFGELD